MRQTQDATGMMAGFWLAVGGARVLNRDDAALVSAYAARTNDETAHKPNKPSDMRKCRPVEQRPKPRSACVH